MKPKETVQALLNDIRNPKTVRDLCAQGVTYVSLNYNNPDLHKIMPWCGTRKGVDAISKTFHDVSECWNIDSFSPEAIFGEDENDSQSNTIMRNARHIRLSRTGLPGFAPGPSRVHGACADVARALATVRAITIRACRVLRA
jgi:hypothetical protein